VQRLAIVHLSEEGNILHRYSLLRTFLPLLIVPTIFLSGCNSTSNSSSTGSSVDAATVSPDGDLQIVENLPPPQNTREGADQLIAENDVLEIDVFQVDELDRTVRVDSNGRISMPLIGTLQAAGKTIPMVEKEMEAKYNTNYLQSPDITIYMKESAGQRVTMDGEFSKPGLYPTVSNSTLLQAIALAGGLTKVADEKKVFVFRQFGTKKLVANYSVEAIRGGKSSDPRLFGGDVIVAFTSKSKVATQNLRDALGIAVSATRIITPF